MITTSHLLLVMLIVLILFGGKKIPDLMRGLAKGLKYFKKGMSDNDEVDGKIRHNYKKNTHTISKTKNITKTKQKNGSSAKQSHSIRGAQKKK